LPFGYPGISGCFPLRASTIYYPFSFYLSDNSLLLILVVHGIAFDMNQDISILLLKDINLLTHKKTTRPVGKSQS